jgi:hypothetical protein
MEKLKIIVGGYIGSYCTSGVTWDYIQYPLGLFLLGHDVYYVEDTYGYACYYDPNYAWDDPTPVVNYLAATMKNFGLQERWAYRDGISGKCFGLSLEKVKELCASADVFINISQSTYMRDEYLKIPKRILIDSDPMFTQIQDAKDFSDEELRKKFLRFNYLFSFGENINAENCRVPKYELKWHITRQPVCLQYWNNNLAIPPASGFTTIMNLAARKKIVYKGEEWGQKDVEFEKILQLPKKYRSSLFKIILSCSVNNKDDKEYSWLKKAGWDIIKADDVIKDVNDYREFIFQSLGEFSVAKETYVKANTGWFSCRSACYLAAGRPVIVQDTEWTKYLPAGQGLLAFTDVQSAFKAIDTVMADTKKHAKAAKEIAAEYFDSEIVLTQMLEQLN